MAFNFEERERGGGGDNACACVNDLSVVLEAWRKDIRQTSLLFPSKFGNCFDCLKWKIKHKHPTPNQNNETAFLPF